MIIYIDLLLIINFLLDYCLIAYTGIINKQKYNYFRLILASIFALTSFSLFFIKIKIIFFILRFLYSLGIIYIAFPYKTLKQYIKNILIFYFLNYLLAGLITSFNFNFSDYLLLVNHKQTTSWYLLIFSFIFANLLTYIYKVIEDNNKSYQGFVYRCYFRFLNQDYHAKGLLDTGNRVESVGSQPIVFIDKKLIKKEVNEDLLMKNNIPFTYVLVNTISESNLHLAFKPETFHIIVNKKAIKKDVYLVLFNNLPELENQFQIILNYKTIT